MARLLLSAFFFFNDTATTEIYTLSLHDALPICKDLERKGVQPASAGKWRRPHGQTAIDIQEHQSARPRSEEHTSELQSQSNLVCRLLLEKKKHAQLAALIGSGPGDIVFTSGATE